MRESPGCSPTAESLQRQAWSTAAELSRFLEAFAAHSGRRQRAGRGRGGGREREKVSLGHEHSARNVLSVPFGSQGHHVLFCFYIFIYFVLIAS